MGRFTIPTKARQRHGSPLWRAVPLPQRRAAIGNQASLRRLQAKLVIGAVNGPQEREADAAAALVMSPASTSLPWISRKCAACEAEESLQGKPAENAPAAASAPLVEEVLRSGGQPLDPGLRGFFEPRFGVDFSAVRIHRDARAASSAKQVGARAYAVGANIAFADGQFAPGARAGRELIAHELAHVVQQGATSGGAQSGIARQIQRDVAAEEDAAVAAPDEADDPSEVYDGDSAVSASADAARQDDSTPAILPDDLSPASDPVAGPTAGEAADTSNSTQAQQAKPRPKNPPPKPAPSRKISTIVVDQAAQSMTITWSDGKSETHPVSTGKGLPNTSDDPCKTQTEKNCTPNVTDVDIGTMGDAGTVNEHGDHMSWYVGFVDERGIGIHNSQPVPGAPASHGCVRVGDGAAGDALAKKINQNVVKGTTKITVKGKAPTHPWKKPVIKPKPKPKSK
jgi:hypothetical protein